jgi:hypothetical protein
MINSRKVKKSKINSKFFIISNLGLILFIFAMLFVNLIQSNEAATEGFILKSLNKKTTELKNANKDLNLISAQLQSINRIKQVSEEQLGMIDADNINYVVIKNAEETVALK